MTDLPAAGPDLACFDVDEQIRRLKRERNAVLLAHYYQESEIQEVADFVGDSLELARAAQRTKADVIVFAGVHFMAETAKILNPDRVVVVPDMEAGCSLADGCPAEAFRAWRIERPEAVAISYINCSAAVKAESDLICTSSNAAKIVQSVPADREILFAPDRHLGRYLNKTLGRKMTLWAGSCVVHEAFSLQKLLALKTRHPQAKIIAHPECEEELLERADFIGSTAGLIKYAERDPGTEYIVVTESGILHEMRKRMPAKVFIAAPPDTDCACSLCPYMRKNTPEKVFLALRDLAPRLDMPEELRRRAQKPIDRMLELS
ncbi:MAG: quinolinate synthase NadA [Polyangiaceae bacterium]|nr:quinolinate synthase NadA [Polyangiaceae bacterium]